MPVHVLAQRAQVSNAEMWAWHQHVTDTASKIRGKDTDKSKGSATETALVSVHPSPVTQKIYQFLLKELSCEVCSGRLCRCCFSFCGVCEQVCVFVHVHCVCVSGVEVCELCACVSCVVCSGRLYRCCFSFCGMSRCVCTCVYICVCVSCVCVSVSVEREQVCSEQRVRGSVCECSRTTNSQNNRHPPYTRTLQPPPHAQRRSHF